MMENEDLSPSMLMGIRRASEESNEEVSSGGSGEADMGLSSSQNESQLSTNNTL